MAGNGPPWAILPSIHVKQEQVAKPVDVGSSDAIYADRMIAQALAHPDFRKFFFGQVSTYVGSWMQQMAVGWLIFQMTGALSALGTLAAVMAAPILLISLFGGVLADRVDRRKLLLVTLSFAPLVDLVIAGLLMTGKMTLGAFYGCALVAGILAAISMPARQAIGPDLVPPELIPQTVALNQLAFFSSRIVGPALALGIMAWTELYWVFIANAICFVPAITSLFVVRPRPAATRHEGAGGALKEGVQYAWGHRQVRALIGMAALTGTCVFPFYNVLMPGFVKQQLGGTEWQLAQVMIAAGIGALAGSVALLRIRAELRGLLVVIGCALASVALGALSFAPDVRWTAGVITLLTLGTGLCMGLSGTLLQIAVPRELLGRVMSLYGATFVVLTPVAALGLGYLGDHFIGLRVLMRLMAVVYGALVVPWLVGAGLRGYQPTHADEANAPAVA